MSHVCDKRTVPLSHSQDGRIRGHSRKAIQLVREFIEILEKIPDGCADPFPFELIDELKEEYLTESKA